MPPDPVAYFTMEIGLEPPMPTYAGGLGILAGDTVRSKEAHRENLQSEGIAEGGCEDLVTSPTMK
jgi:glucan phosphorylase